MPAAAVPDSVAVPLPLSVNVMPVGSVPVRVMLVTAGTAEVVTLKVAAVPTTNVALAALVNAGAEVIVRTKFCVAAVPTPLLAEMVSG